MAIASEEKTKLYLKFTHSSAKMEITRAIVERHGALKIKVYNRRQPNIRKKEDQKNCKICFKRASLRETVNMEIKLATIERNFAQEI